MTEYCDNCKFCKIEMNGDYITWRKCVAPQNPRSEPDKVYGMRRIIQDDPERLRADETLCGPSARWFKPTLLYRFLCATIWRNNKITDDIARDGRA